MFRVAFKIETRFGADMSLPLTPLPVWTVSKCYDVRKEAEPYTLPVKLSTDHGRKRLLILCPFRLPLQTYCTPYEILRAYLLELPDEVKRARAAEMRRAA